MSTFQIVNLCMFFSMSAAMVFVAVGHVKFLRQRVNAEQLLRGNGFHHVVHDKEWHFIGFDHAASNVRVIEVNFFGKSKALRDFKLVDFLDCNLVEEPRQGKGSRFLISIRIARQGEAVIVLFYFDRLLATKAFAEIQNAIEGVYRVRPIFQFDYFICHASTLHEQVARPLVQHLQDIGGRCWLDSEQVADGMQISPRIRDGLAQARQLVVLCSRDMIISQYCRLEIESFWELFMQAGSERSISLVLVDEISREDQAQIFSGLPDFRSITFGHGDFKRLSYDLLIAKTHTSRPEALGPKSVSRSA